MARLTDTSMENLTLETFRNLRHDFDRQVTQTPEVDTFCSSSYWILPAFKALFPNQTAWIRRAESTDGYVALARGYHSRLGYYLQPMEASWGLAAPLIGREIKPLVQEFGREARHYQPDWEMLFLSGIYEGSPLFQQLLREFRGDYAVGIGPSMARHVASLEGGFEDYFSRRSSKFRSNIRRARRKADDEGIETSYHSEFSGPEEADRLFDRILGIERNSWKAEQSSGIASGPMREFYEQMLPLLLEDDRLRIAFVTLDGVDIAYCFGGIFGSLYRGLQLSYHDDYSEYSAGNLAQIAILEGLCEEGIETYDMGQAMDYKSRWADDKQKSIALIVRQ